MLFNHRSCDAEIGRNAYGGAVLADGKTDRIFSIMRYREGMDGQIADAKGLTAFKGFGFMQAAKPGRRLVGFSIDVDGQLVASGKNTDALDMIGMFVADDDGIQLFGVQIS